MICVNPAACEKKCAGFSHCTMCSGDVACPLFCYPNKNGVVKIRKTCYECYLKNAAASAAVSAALRRGEETPSTRVSAALFASQHARATELAESGGPQDQLFGETRAKCLLLAAALDDGNKEIEIAVNHPTNPEGLVYVAGVRNRCLSRT